MRHHRLWWEPGFDSGQHAVAASQALLAERGITWSKNQAGDYLDNAMAESRFATRKAEVADTQVWPTRGSPNRDLRVEWIEAFLNRQRRQSVSPPRRLSCLSEEGFRTIRPPSVTVSALTDQPQICGPGSWGGR